MQRLAHHVRLLARPQAGAVHMRRRSVATTTTSVADSVRQVFRCSDAVCFDVDSTVVREEGIDHLAEVLGKGPAVAQLTKRAMEGGMNFRQALTARLDILQPSREQVARFVSEHPLTLSPGIKELVGALQANGKQVFLVSGGFRQLIEPVAKQVGVPSTHVFANSFLFDEADKEVEEEEERDKQQHEQHHQREQDQEGTKQKKQKRVWFDHSEPTSESGGKGKVISLLQQRHGFKQVVMVGDGATDLEARPPAALFVCYGGVVARQAVKDQADWFVTDFQELIEALK